MRSALAVAAVLAIGFASGGQADLKKAMAEPNLEKRSKLALENAKAAYQAARDAYAKDDLDQVKAFAAEIDESVDLAFQSLEQTGKNPRSSPRYFKHAEQETSQLVRRLDGFQQDMGYEERSLLEKTKAHVQKVHDDLLLELMEGKKK
ncbi:MAG TPA: hypothetical protein VHW24_19300 [Bryobacteraceae bacterium]|jgi:hypothetical protein|nr:hypothetical protein [Bryobacteraceae bacterium]